MMQGEVICPLLTNTVRKCSELEVSFGAGGPEGKPCRACMKKYLLLFAQTGAKY